MPTPNGWTPVATPAPSAWTAVTSDPSVPSDEDIIKNAGTGSPGVLSWLGSQVGDFFSSAAHTLNPENLMAKIPTSWEDLKNKWEAENEDYEANRRGVAEQFKKGNIGVGISTIMNGVPLIGEPTGAAAEDLRNGNVGKALGSIAPFFIPGLEEAPDLASAASEGLGKAKTAARQVAAKAPEALQKTIVQNPNLTRAAAAAGVGVPIAIAGHTISPWGSVTSGVMAGGMAGQGLLKWAREAQLAKVAEAMKGVPDEVLTDALKNPPIQLTKQVRDIVGTGEGAATTRLIENELANRQAAKGIPTWPEQPAPMGPTPRVSMGQTATTDASAPSVAQAGTIETPVNPITALQDNRPTPVPSSATISQSGTIAGRQPEANVPMGPTPSVPTGPVGPSPQLLKDISKATGGNGVGIQRFLDQMVANGEPDPYTGAPLGKPSRPVSAPATPTPTAPNPISALQTPEYTPPPRGGPAAIPDGPVTMGESSLPHDFVPQNVTVLHDTWPYEAGGKERVSMISEDGLKQIAQDLNKSIPETRKMLEDDNYTIPTLQESRQAYLSRAKEMGYERQQRYDMLAAQTGKEKFGDVTQDELLKSYGNLLQEQGPQSAEHLENVRYQKTAQPLPKNVGAPLPINLSTRPDLADAASQGLPQENP